MARFTFSLERVLDIRRQQEEQAKLEVAQAQKRYQEQVAATERAQDVLKAHKDEWRRKSQEGANANELWLFQSYSTRLERDVHEAETLQIQLAKELNAKRRMLVQRAKETKLLEKLKLRQEERHAEEEQRKEQGQLDEISTIRHQPAAF